MHDTIARTRVRRTWLERLDAFLRSNAVRLVLLFLVANTILAQAFFNSGGRILSLFGMDLTASYLNASAILSTLAFSLFEIAMLWARQEVLALDESIKRLINAEAWLKRNRAALIVITAINFYSLAVFNSAIWPSLGVPGIPEPPAPWRYWLHAGFYTVILYMAGIVGERTKSEQEVSMTMARRHTQQALAAHDAQFSQQIKDMTAAGDALAPLMAATSSPETAQLVALQHAAVTGQVSVMDAARLNAAAKGHDTTLLDRLATHSRSIRQTYRAGEDGEDGEAAQPDDSRAADQARQLALEAAVRASSRASSRRIGRGAERDERDERDKRDEGELEPLEEEAEEAEEADLPF